MEQNTQNIYYMVVDEKSTGPYTLDEIILHPKLTPETLVWKPGIENWVAARTLVELKPAFFNRQETVEPEENYQRPPEYHNQNPFANNPQYQQNHTYQNQNYHHQNYHDHRHNPYDGYDNRQNGYRPVMRTNWLPWAIVATVLGFFTSCIGAIFGIIGIVQANKANTFYAQGFDAEGDAANSNARIMTVIGLIFAGLGILFLCFFTSSFSVFSNNYSF